jgi:hypothetical protein
MFRQSLIDALLFDLSQACYWQQSSAQTRILSIAFLKDDADGENLGELSHGISIFF